MARVEKELRTSLLAPLFHALYRATDARRHWGIGRRICRWAARLEGGAWRSATVRALLERHHDVRVGAYSYGECLEPGLFPPGVTVGRYCSIASGARVFNQNHPIEHLSTHPAFYDPALGIVGEEYLPRPRLVIGNDVWMGCNSVVTPGCARVGHGAVLAAGAVVVADVEDFAIVGGVPARTIRYRFPPEQRARILASAWWERSLEELRPHLASLTRPLAEVASSPLLGDPHPPA